MREAGWRSRPPNTEGPADGGTRSTSPLVAARLRRRLTLEEAAALTSLEVDDIKSLEESRTYRFPSTADAIAATVVYASALGITEREARELAGLPVESVVERWSLQPLGDRPRLRRRRRGASSIFVAQAAVLPGRAARRHRRRRSTKPAACRAAPRALGDPGGRLQRHPARERRLRPRERDRRPRLRHRRRSRTPTGATTAETAGLLPAGRRGDRTSASRTSSVSARPRSRAATTRLRLVVIVGDDSG